MSRLNETQFNLFDPAPYTQPGAPVGRPSERSRAVNRLTSVAIERFPNEPPVGLRGSIPEREALALRFQKKRDQHQRWQSMRQRYEDQVWWDEDDLYEAGWDEDGNDYERVQEIPAHPRTGLRSLGPLSTQDDIGMEVVDLKAVPKSARFHGSARSARINHSTVEEVPLWNNITQQHIATVQHDVSSQRVHEIIENPATASANRVPRPHPELPHVYSGEGFGGGDRPFVRDDIVVDGNHRVAADILQGRLFTQAHVMRDEHLPAIAIDSLRIKMAKKRAAEEAVHRGAEKAIQDRTERNYYGRVK